MIKRILLATDGSEPAKSAEEMAFWLAKRLEAEVVALFVKDERLIRFPELLDFGAVTIPLPTYHEEIDRALTERGKAVLERLEKRAKEEGIRFEGRILLGIPYEVIVREARTFDLVVMGRAGEQSGHQATGLGSTVERVTRTSPIPVLVAALRFVTPERVVVGYDGSDAAARALHFVVLFAPPLGVPVVVASVDEDEESARALAQEGVDYLKAHGVEAEAVPLVGPPAERLAGFQKESDILVLGAFGRGRVLELLLGSTTEYVLRRAVGPVTVVR